VQLAGVQDSRNHIVGLTLSETDPTGNRRRLFLGHDKEGVASVSLMDRNGRKRIVLQVTPDGTPSFVSRRRRQGRQSARTDSLAISLWTADGTALP
jgi:hypothetical protein